MPKHYLLCPETHEYFPIDDHFDSRKGQIVKGLEIVEGKEIEAFQKKGFKANSELAAFLYHNKPFHSKLEGDGTIIRDRSTYTETQDSTGSITTEFQPYEDTIILGSSENRDRFGHTLDRNSYAQLFQGEIDNRVDEQLGPYEPPVLSVEEQWQEINGAIDEIKQESATEQNPDELEEMWNGGSDGWA